MKCRISSGFIGNNDSALVVFVDSSLQLSSSLLSDAQTDTIQKLIQSANFKGEVNSTLLDFTFNENGFGALLLVGIGNAEEISENNLQKLAVSVYKQLAKKSASIEIAMDDRMNVQQFGIFSLALLNASYQFDTYKSKKIENTLSEVVFVTQSDKKQSAYLSELEYVSAVSVGQAQARELGNAPANDCYPASIAEQAQALANTFSDTLTVEVLGEAEMEQLGMGCFLSVSKGSEREGKLITFSYKGKGAKNTDAPIVLVGKGVTFDTGGISIKPGAGMEEMKFDMCGAASVFGTIKALCEAQLPVHVIGTLACAENMPSGKATRPGDIVTSMSGQTVEILNTDAEGRLVLSDALTYVEKYNPSVVINMATLTGACVIALGHVRSAMYTKDMDLAADLIAASTYSHDRLWHMPLDDDYQDQLESPCADMQNIGGRPAGSITAACFLSRFTKKYRWAHLDIAGTAWVSGKSRNATGRPVPLLMQYIRSSLG